MKTNSDSFLFRTSYFRFIYKYIPFFEAKPWTQHASIIDHQHSVDSFVICDFCLRLGQVGWCVVSLNMLF